jgi:hypothetical protein
VRDKRVTANYVSLTAEHIDLVRGASADVDVTIENAHVVMFDGYLRLLLSDDDGRLAVAAKRHFFKDVNEKDDLSRIQHVFEYHLANGTPAIAH